MAMTLRGPVPTLALITVLVAVSTLAYAGHFAYNTATYVPAPGEDASLYGVAYLYSILLAVPAATCLGLAAVGYVARRSRPRWASGVTTAGLITAGRPLVVVGTTLMH